MKKLAAVVRVDLHIVKGQIAGIDLTGAAAGLQIETDREPRLPEDPGRRIFGCRPLPETVPHQENVVKKDINRGIVRVT